MDKIRLLNLVADPIVFALSCLKGNHEGKWWEYIALSESKGPDDTPI